MINRLIYVLSFPVLGMAMLALAVSQLALILVTMPVSALIMLFGYVIFGDEDRLPAPHDFLCDEWLYHRIERLSD